MKGKNTQRTNFPSSTLYLISVTWEDFKWNFPFEWHWNSLDLEYLWKNGKVAVSEQHTWWNSNEPYFLLQCSCVPETFFCYLKRCWLFLIISPSFQNLHFYGWKTNHAAIYLDKRVELCFSAMSLNVQTAELFGCSDQISA